MNDTVKLALEAFDELQAQKQKIWDMANDLFKVLQHAEATIKRGAPEPERSETLALIETTLDLYSKKG